MSTLTAPQQSFIATLAAQRDISTQPHLANSITKAAEGTLTKAYASTLISSLKVMPFIPTATAPAAAEGYYVDEDEAVFVVVSNKARTSTYAKQMVVRNGKGRWVYAPGVGRTLAGLTPLTVEEAARLSRHHGCCVICGAALTDPKSVARGIGPTCATRL